jgi:hypothetical protein
MSRRRIVVLTLAILLALGLGYMLGGERNFGDSLTIRTYPVPAENGDDLRRALSNLFYTAKDKPRDANVELVNNNLLVVKAPRQLQRDVAKFIAEFAKTSKTKTPIKFELWVIEAVEGIGNGSTMGEIQAPLEALTGADKKTFTVKDHLILESVEFESAEARGPSATIKVYDARVVGDRIQAEIRSSYDHNSSSEVHVNLLNEGFTVIGSGHASQQPGSKEPKKETFSIIRATVLK